MFIEFSVKAISYLSYMCLLSEFCLSLSLAEKPDVTSFSEKVPNHLLFHHIFLLSIFFLFRIWSQMLRLFYHCLFLYIASYITSLFLFLFLLLTNVNTTTFYWEFMKPIWMVQCLQISVLSLSLNPCVCVACVYVFSLCVLCVCMLSRMSAYTIRHILRHDLDT